MDEDSGTIIGICLLAISACLGVVCIFLLRILVNAKRGGHISTIRMWLHVSTALEQISFLIFHIMYHFLESDLKDKSSCIMLRFISSLASTLTNSWIFVISSFYLVLTIKPAKCFSFHSRFLSHCISLTWTCVSCLMYLMLSYTLQEEFHTAYIHSCWESNPRTIHICLTYGNELIPFLFSFVFISCARCRIPFKREVLQRFSRQSHYNVNVECITNVINRYVILSLFLIIYYISVTFRIILVHSGSDFILIAMQSGKGIIICIMTCLLSNDVISVICRQKQTPHTNRNDYTESSGLMHRTRYNENIGGLELETLAFV